MNDTQKKILEQAAHNAKIKLERFRRQRDDTAVELERLQGLYDEALKEFEALSEYFNADAYRSW